MQELRRSDKETRPPCGVLALGRPAHAACLPLLLSATGSQCEESTGTVIPTRRVLVVEDEPAIRELVTMILEDDGLAVEAATNGCEALARARRRPPDVVILDLMMAAMSGWELIKVLQADAATRHIPIVVVSAAYPATTAAALGVHAFLSKPFDVDQLLTILQTLNGEDRR